MVFHGGSGHAADPSILAALTIATSTNSTPPVDPSGFHEHTFDSVFPLPFRVLSLFSLALLSWAAVLHLLYRLRLDPTPLLEQKTNPASHIHRSRLYPPVYHAGLSLSLLTLIGLGLDRLFGQLSSLPAPLAHFLSASPALLLALLPFRLAPFASHFRTSHRRLHLALRRILVPVFPPHSITMFCDILLADVLTSLSRPLGDLSALLGQTLYLADDLQTTLTLSCTCLPYLLRFRQCVNDVLIGDERSKSLLNALKYSSAVPMIVLGSRLDGGGAEGREWRVLCWATASTVNSVYSCWWDVVNDWGLLRRKAEAEDRLLFGDQRAIYLLAAFINVAVRMSWTAGISRRPGPKLGYLLELLEVLRRALWCLLRIEWGEIVRRQKEYFELSTENVGGLDSEEEPSEDETGPDRALEPMIQSSRSEKLTHAW